jgi:CRISPR-associated endonuclease/helicase Cas3
MWRNPAEVYTHEGKKFYEHVEEIINSGYSFLTFYQMPAKCFDWLKFLAEYHDIGKTHKDWELEKLREEAKKRVPHSSYSVEYFLDLNNRQKLFGKFQKEEAWLLLYLIAKHHQSLTDDASDDFTRFVIRQVKDLLEKGYSWTSLIQLVDTFGLFKLADVCSACDKLDFRLSKPHVDESTVRRIIGHRIDEERFAQQKAVLTSCPDIAILRAYTGWGKTDVSMLFFEQRPVSRIFYMFPTITAINKFWNKIEGAVGGNVSRFFHLYLAEIKDKEEMIENFFYIRNFASFPYIITTVDQFLLTFLQVGRYYLRRPMFRNSGIVIDEVHLFTPLMLHLLVWFLKKFREPYQLRVLFMSATLPNGLSSYLLSELGLQKNSLLDFSRQYENKRRIMWQRENKRIDEFLEEILQSSSGRKVLVVVNTVEKAIQLAHKLEQIKKYEKDFNVIHARYVYEDRRKKEEWVHQQTQRNSPHVLVSTQVCEVSLDVNYDVLITELASIPALIQRFGRVNRYGEKTEEINVYVTEPDCNVERYPYTHQELSEALR